MAIAAQCPTCKRAVWVDQGGACLSCGRSFDAATQYRALPQCSTPPKCDPPARKNASEAELVEAVSAVDKAWADLLRARSILPPARPRLVKKLAYKTSDFYLREDPLLNPAEVKFDRRLSAADVDSLGSAAHSVNEGGILRLYAILDAVGALQPLLDKSDSVERTILALKGLRNEIAHGRRQCDPGNRDQRVLLDEIVGIFYGQPLDSAHQKELKDINRDIASDGPFNWPLSILGVLRPMHSSVRKYLQRFPEESDDLIVQGTR